MGWACAVLIEPGIRYPSVFVVVGLYCSLEAQTKFGRIAENMISFETAVYPRDQQSGAYFQIALSTVVTVHA